MKLECIKCGESIAAEDINLNRLLAKCSACNAVFSFAEQVDASARGVQGVRDPVRLPKGMRDESSRSGLRLVRRWFGPCVIFLAIFCMMWDGFLVFWYSAALKEGAPLVMKVAPLVHVLVGLVLSYWVVAGFVNSTVVEVTGGALRVRHGPLPVPGNRCLSASDIKQLHCRRRVRRTRQSVYYRYDVRVTLTTGKTLALLKGLDTADVALYYEQQIEQFLGIEDEPVAGELPRAADTTPAALV